MAFSASAQAPVQDYWGDTVCAGDYILDTSLGPDSDGMILFLLNSLPPLLLLLLPPPPPLLVNISTYIEVVIMHLGKGLLGVESGRTNP